MSSAWMASMTRGSVTGIPTAFPPRVHRTRLRHARPVTVPRWSVGESGDSYHGTGENPLTGRAGRRYYPDAKRPPRQMTGRGGSTMRGAWLIVVLLAGCSATPVVTVAPSATAVSIPTATPRPTPLATPEFGQAAQHMLNAMDRLAAGADPREWFMAEARWLTEEPVVLPSDVLSTYRTIVMAGMAGDYAKATRLVLDMRPIVVRLLR